MLNNLSPNNAHSYNQPCIHMKIPFAVRKLSFVRHPSSFRNRAALGVLALVLGGAPLASARVDGSGHVITENRQVSGVSVVELRGFGDLEIVQGDTEGIVLTGEDNILALVTTDVDAQGTLHIGLKKNEGITTHEKLKISLAVKTLSGLELAGSGNVHARELKGKTPGDFSVTLAGSGNVNLDKLEAGALKVTVAGSGTIKVAGEVPAQRVEIAGSGDYDAPKLKSATATVTVNGSGDVDIWATDTLDATVNGSGDVDYHGQPKVKKQVHGSGSVEAVNEKQTVKDKEA